MKLWVFAFVMFPFLYFLSGWRKPASAFVVTILYEVGLLGLIFMYESRRVPENPRSWVYLIFGFSLILTVFIMFETLIGM